MKALRMLRSAFAVTDMAHSSQGFDGQIKKLCILMRQGMTKIRDAGTGGAGGAAAPLAFCWEGQGGQKCPLSIKNII